MLTEEERKLRRIESNKRWRERNRELVNKRAREKYASLSEEEKQKLRVIRNKNSNAYNKRNVEKKTAYHRDWRNNKGGKEKMKESHRKYYLKNRDKILAYGKEWRLHQKGTEAYAKLKEKND